MKSQNIEGCRKFFPAIDKKIYVDTAATGLLHKELIAWRQKHSVDLLNEGSAQWSDHIQILTNVRSGIREFFSVGDDSVALIPNFSLGLNLLLENMDTGRNVLLLENDYPSLNWPFEKRGFNVQYVLPDHQMEAQILHYLSTRKIDILAISLVQWLNGVKINPGFLKKLKEQFPEIIIIADGTQFCGAFDIDFSQSGIDVLGASGYKWLLGGYGNGFMIISNHFSNRVKISSVGFNSAEGDLAAKQAIPLYKQLEPGHLDSLNFGSLSFGMGFLQEIGIQQIEAQNHLLSEKAKREFGALGLLDEAIISRKDHGAIFRLNAGIEIFEHLLSRGVHCSWRAGAIRLSFHFYNTEKEIDRIVEIIKMAD